jgi:hypothetical protein
MTSAADHGTLGMQTLLKDVTDGGVRASGAVQRGIGVAVPAT